MTDEELSVKAAEAAAKATCDRCSRFMIRSSGPAGLITGTFRGIGVRGTKHFSLCAVCGPIFRRFLFGDGEFS